jgi:hypothetical protein
MEGTRLKLKSIETDAEEAPQPSPAIENAGLQMLLMGLRALSQRSLVAVASLVDLALLASAFVLWLKIIREPSPVQLAGVGGYAVFILAAIWIRSR